MWGIPDCIGLFGVVGAALCFVNDARPLSHWGGLPGLFDHQRFWLYVMMFDG